MEFRLSLFAGSTLVACLALPHTALQAQTSGRGVDLIPRMQNMARGLGVTCEYCHTARRGSGLPEPKKDIARKMMAMTEEINARITLATGHSADETTRVDCVTCHRGVVIPGQLSDILDKTLREKDSDAAIEQYRQLRSRYYGRQSYDFGEDTLLSVAQKAAQLDPEDAIDLLKINIEFNPVSVRSYSAIAAAYQRIFDDAAAIAALEQALRIEPNNGVVQGQLLQLRSYQRRRQMMNGDTPKPQPPPPR